MIISQFWSADKRREAKVDLNVIGFDPDGEPWGFYTIYYYLDDEIMKHTIYHVVVTLAEAEEKAEDWVL